MKKLIAKFLTPTGPSPSLDTANEKDSRNHHLVNKPQIIFQRSIRLASRHKLTVVRVNRLHYLANHLLKVDIQKKTAD